jgi:hypothetical protein
MVPAAKVAQLCCAGIVAFLSPPDASQRHPARFNRGTDGLVVAVVMPAIRDQPCRVLPSWPTEMPDNG